MLTVAITTFSDGDFIRKFDYLADSVPIDLTGSVLKMAVKKLATDVTAEIAISSAEPYSIELGGIRIEDAEEALFVVHLPLLQLRRMAPGDYVHSLIRIRPDGIHEVVWEGTLTHNAGPTR